MNTIDTTPAVPAAVSLEWSMRYTMTPKALALIRIQVRQRLTLWSWTADDVESAVFIANELAGNAVQHAAMPGHQALMRLALLEDDSLLIDVSDPVAAFPDFGASRAVGPEAEEGRGLSMVRVLGADLWWFLRPNVGKTVRAHLRG
ncbi:ATP-binding protein [Streptomyces sp. NPDC050738]|uniref:ATP-binding protein n=1 Tax=Streptomyces sp. NPDC050738 TaxID=3154744 RepID=UPI00341C007F